MSKLRTLKAVLGTTLFVSVTGFIVGTNMTVAHSPGGFNGGILVASIATVVALIAVLFWALPMHFFLHYNDIQLMRWYALAGTVPSIIIIFIGNFFGSDPFLTQLLQAIPIAIYGAVCACVFYYLVNEKNT